MRKGVVKSHFLHDAACLNDCLSTRMQFSAKHFSSKTNVAPMNDTKRGKQDTSMTER